MAHLHVVCNLEPLVAAMGGDLSAVYSFLAEAWGRLGGGWIWYGRGDTGSDGSRKAAAYLSKYIAKAQVLPPPWDEWRYCTEDIGFRKRPWRRYWCSRKAGKVIASTTKDIEGTTPATAHIVMVPMKVHPNTTETAIVKRYPDKLLFEVHELVMMGGNPASVVHEKGIPDDEMSAFLSALAVYSAPHPTMEAKVVKCQLTRREFLPSGKARYMPWNPAKGSAIVLECAGHRMTPEWVPGTCHHEGLALVDGQAYLVLNAEGEWVQQRTCFCVPPWAIDWCPDDVVTRADPETGEALETLGDRFRRQLASLREDPRTADRRRAAVDGLATLEKPWSTVGDVLAQHRADRAAEHASRPRGWSDAEWAEYLENESPTTSS